jgi:hypothetical protein
MQVHFFSPTGFMPMKDKGLKALIGGSHGWQDTGETWVFGVAEPKDGVHPADVRDKLAALGVIPLPSFADTDTPIDAKVYGALSKWIAPNDRTRTIAQKMGKQHPLLRPAE